MHGIQLVQPPQHRSSMRLSLGRFAQGSVGSGGQAATTECLQRIDDIFVRFKVTRPSS
jgi:hypothetical protein